MDDGPRLPGRVRAPRQRAGTCGSRCASLFVVPFLPLAAAGRRCCTSTCWCCSASRSRWRSSTTREIGISVPLAYPFLLYLLVRMLLLGVRARPPARAAAPARARVVAGVADVFLVGFRVGLNVTNSNVIDVGYAGVIGADKLIHGQHLYGHWPQGQPAAATPTGPVNYYAYVPVPRRSSAGAAPGTTCPPRTRRRSRSTCSRCSGCTSSGGGSAARTLGVVLAYAWAAYPFTLYALNSNSNDSLVAMLVVLALLVITSAPRGGWRGASRDDEVRAAGAGAAAVARGRRPWPRRRTVLASCVAFALTGGGGDAPGAARAQPARVLARLGLPTRPSRGSPFSIWGLWGGLNFEQHLVQGAAVGLALAMAFVPRRRDIVVRSPRWARRSLIALQLGDHALVLPVHRVVLPAGDGRAAGRLPGARRRARQRLARPTSAEPAPAADPGRLSVQPGAGTSTCSIESARIGSSGPDQHSVQPRVLGRGLEADRHLA